MVNETAIEYEQKIGERIAERVANLTHQTIYAHRRIISEIGGSSGIREESALQSAVAAPFASFSGEDLHSTIFQKAAVLMRSLSLNHPFTDGNKRVSLTMTAAFLFEHGFGFKEALEDDAIVQFCLDLANHKKSLEEITEWLRINTDRSSVRSFREVMEKLHDV